MEPNSSVVQAVLELLGAANVGVFEGDGYHLTEVNDAMTRLFGRSRSELIGREPSSFIAPADRVVMAEAASDWTGNIARRRISILRPDGEPLPALLLSLSVGEGHRVGFVIDESKASTAEFELGVLRSMADHSPAGVLVWDAAAATRGVDMRLHWISKPMLSLLQAERADVLGVRLGDLLPFIDPLLADRALGLAGTDRVERIGEMVLPGSEPRTLDRMIIGLPRKLVAVRVADVTDERVDEQRRVELVRRVVDIGDAERQQLAMDLHDDAIQQASAAAVLLEGLAARPDHPDRASRLATASSAVRNTVEALRRLVFELSPPELVESGIEAALASALEYLFAGTDVATKLDVTQAPDVTVQASVVTATFRIAVEALTNVRKHAVASSVTVGLDITRAGLELMVRDDGIGLGAESAVPGHFGVRSMIERAAGSGGRCTIGAADGGGVELRAHLPLTELRPDLSQQQWVMPDPGEILSLRASLRDAGLSIVTAQDIADETRRKLDVLMEVGRALTTTPSTPARVAAQAVELISAATSCGAVIHLNSPTTALQLVAASVGDDVLDETNNYVVKPGHLLAALRGGSPINIDQSASPGDGGYQAMTLPMTILGTSIGTLTLVRSPDSVDCSDEYIAYATGLAAQVAAAIKLAEHATGPPQ